MILYRPSEPEERQGHEHGADVGEREAELGFGDVFIATCEGVVDGIDAGDEKPDGGEEAEARGEIQEADLGGGEAVAVTEDSLEVCVETIVRAENYSLVYGHYEDDGLGEEDF